VDVLTPNVVRKPSFKFQGTNRKSTHKMKSAIKRYFGRSRSVSADSEKRKRLFEARQKFLVFRNDDESMYKGQEVGMFVDESTPLVRIQEHVGACFNFDPPLARLYFPLSTNFEYRAGEAKEVGVMKECDSQAVFETAFQLWSRRAAENQKK
jgi:hypothetical protein